LPVTDLAPLADNILMNGMAVSRLFFCNRIAIRRLSARPASIRGPAHALRGTRPPWNSKHCTGQSMPAVSARTRDSSRRRIARRIGSACFR